MTNQVVAKIEDQMKEYLDVSQMERLHTVLLSCVHETLQNPDIDHVKIFIAAKRVEGCSNKTLKYYESTLRIVFHAIGKSILSINTDDLRLYLNNYEANQKVSRVTLDNVRRILSSFFDWLEDEDFIRKSPVRRIHKIKTCKMVKETYSDEVLEILRDQCGSLRDLALINVLFSTGVRVGEVVLLNRSDIDFINRECIVLGKGNKQRKVYFDARTKIHLQKYLESRTDSNPALFVSLRKPYARMTTNGIENRLKTLGQKLNLGRIHPHKFRRTLATMAIDKGMPIEQVQQILGHQNIGTTLHYAMVEQTNVKNSHKKFIG